MRYQKVHLDEQSVGDSLASCLPSRQRMQPTTSLPAGSLNARMRGGRPLQRSTRRTQATGRGFQRSPPATPASSHDGDLPSSHEAACRQQAGAREACQRER